MIDDYVVQLDLSSIVVDGYDSPILVTKLLRAGLIKHVDPMETTCSLKCRSNCGYHIKRPSKLVQVMNKFDFKLIFFCRS